MIDLAGKVIICFTVYYTVTFTVLHVEKMIVLSKLDSAEENAHLEQLKKRARALSRGTASGVVDIGRPTAWFWTPNKTPHDTAHKRGDSSSSGWWWW